MAGTILGRTSWELKRGNDGHRDYNIEWLIQADDQEDGPFTIFNTPGLPLIGTWWSYGNDDDPWAFCKADWSAKPVLTREPNFYWLVNQLFSTRPNKRCMDNSIENPLDEPPDVGGSFAKYTKEATQDINGRPVRSSSFERFKGSLVERDFNRPTLEIGLNLAELPLGTICQQIDTRNDSPIWGIDEGQAKLSTVAWQRKLFGTCSFYYTVKYGFDLDQNKFVRYIQDEGHKKLKPSGDPTDPSHYIAAKDALEENVVIPLNGSGAPLGAGASPYYFAFQFYGQSNYGALGVPFSF